MQYLVLLILVFFTFSFTEKKCETEFVETVYHHTEYVYPRDDIGLIHLTVNDIEEVL